jgi:hypothetical protein
MCSITVCCIRQDRGYSKLLCITGRKVLKD